MAHAESIALHRMRRGECTLPRESREHTQATEAGRLLSEELGWARTALYLSLTVAE